MSSPAASHKSTIDEHDEGKTRNDSSQHTDPGLTLVTSFKEPKSDTENVDQRKQMHSGEHMKAPSSPSSWPLSYTSISSEYSVPASDISKLLEGVGEGQCFRADTNDGLARDLEEMDTDGASANEEHINDRRQREAWVRDILRQINEHFPPALLAVEQQVALDHGINRLYRSVGLILLVSFILLVLIWGCIIVYHTEAEGNFVVSRGQLVLLILLALLIPHSRMMFSALERL